MPRPSARLASSHIPLFDFRGSRWVNIHNEANRQYLLNAYRVLLTRARQGTVVVVPPGTPEDPTHNPAWYDRTYSYLKSLGIPKLGPEK